MRVRTWFAAMQDALKSRAPGTRAAAQPYIHQLGGRSYREINESTAEHQFWLMARISEAGVDRIEIREGEDLDAMASRVTTALLSGPIFEIFGGLLIPSDTGSEAWTPQLAARTAAELRAITDRSELAQLRAMTANLVAGFFAAGLASVRNLETYFATKETSPNQPTESAPTSRDSDLATASSGSSSGKSQPGTSTAPRI